MGERKCEIELDIKGAKMGFFNILGDAMSYVEFELIDDVKDKVSDAVDYAKENPGKAAVGAVIGVAAVAAAPFTGGGSVAGAATLGGSLAGAGAVATAAAAGVTGAVVGSTMGGKEKSQAESEGYKKGEREATAKEEIKAKEMVEKLRKEFSEVGNYFDAIYALEAVGVSVANCDGEICSREKEHIEAFVQGILEGELPSSVKNKVAEIYEKKPNINEAFSMAKKSGVSMECFDEVIYIVMHADEKIHENEKAFVETWKILKSA